MNHRTTAAGAIRPYRQIEPALRLYAEILCPGATVVAGDFNNNVTWDKPGRKDNFTATVEAAAAVGLVSAYHTIRTAAFGAEPDPTLYWRDRTALGPRYHIDFCFIPREWVPYVTSVTVGDFSVWVGSGLSDHVPLIVDVALPIEPQPGSQRGASRILNYKG